MTTILRVLGFASFLTVLGAAGASRADDAVTWVSGDGSWTESERWANGTRDGPRSDERVENLL